MARRRYKSRRTAFRNPKSRKTVKNPFRQYGIIAGSKEFLRNLFTTKAGWKKIGIGIGIFLGLIILLAAWYAKDLPSPSKINSKVSAQSTQIFDRNGKLLYEVHGNENRILVDWNQIPDNVKNATVAVEDKNFYHEPGFDVKRIVGAAFYDIIHSDKSQGGSTITQQYVKNALLSNEKSFSRKIKEIMLSVMIEQMYSKDDILKMYLNEIPYGSNAYGIQVAAKTYFNKDAKDLDLAQSATLAALPNAPTYYSPYGQHKDKLMERKDMILDLMVDQHYITQSQADAAKKEQLVFSDNPYGSITAPHFVMYVKQLLIDKYGENAVDTGGLKVYTTLDLDKQKMAEDAVAKYADKNARYYNASNESLVAEDPRTGQVLAMVGSRDFFDTKIDGNVNVAISGRQPGSSFKPYVYATLFKSENWGPGSTIYDVKTDFGGGYIPENYEGNFMGPQSVRSALQGSRNIPAVKAIYMAGVNNSIATAKSMGITTLGDSSQYGLSLVLGAGNVTLLDHTSAYGVFADGGVKHDPTVFLKIEDASGKTLEQYKDSSGQRVLDPQVAYLMSNILSDDPARAYVFGRSGYLTLNGRPVAAKTGTTDNFKDGWTMGYTPSLVAGVWAGNSDGTPMKWGADGYYVAAPIWHEFMTKSLAGTVTEQFNRPSGIKTVTLDAITGKKPTAATKETRTDIFPSWYQVPTSDAGSTYKIDKTNGLLATDSCPADLVQIVTSSNALTAEIPKSDPSYQRWFGPIAAWAQGHGYATSNNPPPTQVSPNCSVPPNPSSNTTSEINITDPADGSNVTSPIAIDMYASTPNGIDSITVTVDNQTSYQASQMANGNGYTANIPLTAGSHTIFATLKDKNGTTKQSSVITVTVQP